MYIMAFGDKQEAERIAAEEELRRMAEMDETNTGGL